MGELEGILKEGIDALGVQLAGEALGRLVTFARLIWDGQQQARLTGAATLQELVARHLVDCATLWRLDDLRWDRWIDVGSGAGLPGMVIALGNGGGRGTLLEATGKKASFLRQAVEALGLKSRVQVVQERAEEWGQGSGREAYAVAVARAVAPARILVEYLLPLVEVGGTAVLMKGPRAGEELEEARKALKVLGGSVEGVERLALPGDGGERRIVRVRKVRPTPAEYPRRAGVPSKRPL